MPLLNIIPNFSHWMKWHKWQNEYFKHFFYIHYLLWRAVLFLQKSNIFHLTLCKKMLSKKGWYVIGTIQSITLIFSYNSDLSISRSENSCFKNSKSKIRFSISYLRFGNICIYIYYMEGLDRNVYFYFKFYFSCKNLYV